MSKRRRLRGVTLVEVLIALCIAAVLLASAVPGFQGALERLVDTASATTARRALSSHEPSYRK